MTVAHDIDPPASTNFGEVMRSRREELRMTQAQLAAAIGVSSRTVGSYERSVFDPPLGLVPVIGRALGVRFVEDGRGGFQAVALEPEHPPAPQVVVLVAATAEAMDAALDRLGVPQAE